MDTISIKTWIRFFVVSACIFLFGNAAQAQSAYHIGALFPLSGPAATFGNMYHDAAELSVTHVTADKLLSKPLVIDYEDSQAQPQTAVIAMNKMVRISQLPVVLTGFSGVSKAIAPIGTRQKVLMINGGASAPDLAKLSPYFFNLIPLANHEVDRLLPYLAQKRQVKRISVVYLDDPLGQSVVTALENGVKANGQQVVGKYAVSPSTSQFGAIAEKVKADRPDAVFLAYYGQQLIALAKQLRDSGVQAPFVGISTIGDPNYIAAPAGEGTIYASQAIDWNSKDMLTQRFVKDFQDKYKTFPSPYAVNYYNAVRMVAEAMRALEQKHQAITGENLKDEIEKTKTYTLVGGAFKFQPDGTVLMPIQINLVHQGKLQVVESGNAADAAAPRK